MALTSRAQKTTLNLKISSEGLRLVGFKSNTTVKEGNILRKKNRNTRSGYGLSVHVKYCLYIVDTTF